MVIVGTLSTSRRLEELMQSNHTASIYSQQHQQQEKCFNCYCASGTHCSSFPGGTGDHFLGDEAAYFYLVARFKLLEL